MQQYFDEFGEHPPDSAPVDNTLLRPAYGQQILKNGIGVYSVYYEAVFGSIFTFAPPA